MPEVSVTKNIKSNQISWYEGKRKNQMCKKRNQIESRLKLKDSGTVVAPAVVPAPWGANHGFFPRGDFENWQF